MNQTAPRNPAEADNSPADAPALDALRWNWGDAYEITVGNGMWSAVRRDGLGDAIKTDGDAGLRDAIWADYNLKPVSRDYAPAEE